MYRLRCSDALNAAYCNGAQTLLTSQHTGFANTLVKSQVLAVSVRTPIQNCQPVENSRCRNCSISMASTSCPVSGNQYALTKVSLLDVPFIFDLMMNGSELGVFSDSFMKKTGGFDLFWWIFRRIFAQSKSYKPLAKRSDWHLIFMNTEQIGFMRIKTSYTPNGDAIKHVFLFALVPQYRNHGHGTAVLKSFVDAQPKGTKIFVHCTKYAKAMQHVLKRLRFRRNAKAGYGVEEYCLVQV